MPKLLYSIAVIIDTLNPPLLVVGLLAAGVGLIFVTSKRHAAALILSSLLAWGASHILKLLFAVPRLDSALVEVTGYRFPSTHALVASAFFSSLCFSALCLPYAPFKKALIGTLALLCVVVIAWSRVFLHAHLPIDVIVGSLLGAGISFVIHFIVLRKRHPRGWRFLLPRH